MIKNSPLKRTVPLDPNGLRPIVRPDKPEGPLKVKRSLSAGDLGAPRSSATSPARGPKKVTQLRSDATAATPQRLRPLCGPRGEPVQSFGRSPGEGLAPSRRVPQSLARHPEASPVVRRERAMSSLQGAGRVRRQPSLRIQGPEAAERASRRVEDSPKPKKSLVNKLGLRKVQPPGLEADGLPDLEQMPYIIRDLCTGKKYQPIKESFLAFGAEMQVEKKIECFFDIVGFNPYLDVAPFAAHDFVHKYLGDDALNSLFTDEQRREAARCAQEGNMLEFHQVLMGGGQHSGVTMYQLACTSVHAHYLDFLNAHHKGA